MSSYIAEPHPDVPDVAFVVLEPRPDEQFGETAGTCAGPSALDNAWTVAGLLRQNRGRQPGHEQCARLGYTPSEYYDEPGRAHL
jgi:hypothetical protein